MQLHNDVPVVHATATINMAKSKTKVGNFWQKVVYFYVYNLPNLLLTIFSTFIFRIAKAQLDAIFPRKRHFRWSHNYVKIYSIVISKFWKKFYTFLVERTIRIMCVKNSKNTFKSVKVIHEWLFSGHGVHDHTVH